MDVSVARADLEERHRDATGVYLCIEAYGDANTTFELQAAFSGVPDVVRADTRSRENGSDRLSVFAPSRNDLREPAGTCDESTGACACRSTTTTRSTPDGDDGGEGDASSDGIARVRGVRGANRFRVRAHRNAGPITRRARRTRGTSCLHLGSWMTIERW